MSRIAALCLAVAIAIGIALGLAGCPEKRERSANPAPKSVEAPPVVNPTVPPAVRYPGITR